MSMLTLVLKERVVSVNTDDISCIIVDRELIEPSKYVRFDAFWHNRIWIKLRCGDVMEEYVDNPSVMNNILSYLGMSTAKHDIMEVLSRGGHLIVYDTDSGIIKDEQYNNSIPDNSET